MQQTPIHWHEGLFLRQQHFQLFDRQVRDLVFSERRLSWAYPYGVIELKPSYEDLENFRVRFDKLKIAMPSGAVLSYPENSELPSLDIRDAFASNPRGFTIYLGLPIWLSERSNVLEGADRSDRVKARFRVANELLEVSDENSGQDPQAVQVRRYNPVLLLEDDDDGDMEKIPLLRIVHDLSHEEPFPRLDPAYVPPCLLISASPTLREKVKDLFAQVAAVREQLANIVARGSEAATMSRLQIQQLLRLRSLNGFVSRLPALLEVGEGAVQVPPLIIYLELRELLGELMALLPERGDFAVAPYKHDDPYLSFDAVITQIRNYLHGSVAPDYMKVDFSEQKGILVADLEDKHIREAGGYYLGIRSNLEPSRLVEIVEDPRKFQLLPLSCVDHRITGVLLQEERNPPLELPADSGRYYFQLQTTRSRKRWQDIVEEMKMIVRFLDEDEDIEGLEVKLYMTIASQNKE